MRSAMILAAMLALAGCESLDLNTNKSSDDATETDAGSSGQIEEDVIETDTSEPQASDDVTAESDTTVVDDDAVETDAEESDASEPQPMSCPDHDGDGVCVQNAAGEELDCDDEDPDTYKNAPELCDGVDNDCDGEIDDGVETWLLYEDHDSDGYGSGEKEETCSKVGYANEAGDCNDSDPDIHPGADDPSGDGIDQNCDDGVAVEQGSTDADADATETNTEESDAGSTESDAGMDPEAVFGGVITHDSVVVNNESDAGSSETEEDAGNTDESDVGSTQVDSGDTEETDVTNANDESDTSDESDAGSTETDVTDEDTTETDTGTEPVIPIAYLTSDFEEEHELSLTYQLAQSEEGLGSKWDNESDPVVEDSDDSVFTEFEMSEDIAFVRVNVTIDGEAWLCSGNGETAEVYEGSFTTLDLPTGYQGMAPFIWDDPSGSGCSLVFEVWYVGNN